MTLLIRRGRDAASFLRLARNGGLLGEPGVRGGGPVRALRGPPA